MCLYSEASSIQPDLICKHDVFPCKSCKALLSLGVHLFVFCSPMASQHAFHLRPPSFFPLLSFLSFYGLAPVRQGDCKMAPPLFSPPVFKHGTHSSSCNQADPHDSTELLRCANREEGWKQTSFPAAGLFCPAVEVWLCVGVLRKRLLLWKDEKLHLHL